MKPEHLEKATELVKLLKAKKELKSQLENLGNVRSIEFYPFLGKTVMLDKQQDEIGQYQIDHILYTCIEHLKKQIHDLELEIEKL